MILRILFTLALAGAALGGAAVAGAQETVRWYGIACGHSRIAVPDGLRCRTTQNYSGGQRGWEADAGGTFRNWVAQGSENGSIVFYYLAEATSSGASIMEGASLQKDIRSEMRDGRMTRDFSPLGHRKGADFMTFTSEHGHACVGVRRYGPSQGDGFLWILYGIRCAPLGGTLGQAEVDAFIASARVRAT